MHYNLFKPITNKIIHGFTLLELLISLSLSSMVLLILVGSFYQLSRNWEKQNYLLDEHIDQSLILIEIEKALSAAYPFTYKDETSLKNNIFFVGTSKKLQWVSTVSPSYDNNLMVWSITLLNNGFKLLVTPVLNGNPDNKIQYALSNTEDSEMMLLNEYTITPAYLFKNLSGKKEWLDSWSVQEKQNLPIAVRLKFEVIKENLKLTSFNLISPIAAHQYQPIRTIPR